MPGLSLRVALALALCGLVLGAACGSDEPAEANIDGFKIEPSDVTLSLQTTDPTNGEVELSAEGRFDGSAATLEIDGTGAPNSAGFYGHFDRYSVEYDGEAAYFDVLPEDEPLELDLESASSYAGRDINQLRELVLVDPTLLARLVESAGPGTSGGEGRVDGERLARFNLTPPRADELVRRLDELYGIEDLTLTVLAESDGTVRRVDLEPTYEMVPDSSATVTFTATLTFTP